jgi:transaldolase
MYLPIIARLIQEDIPVNATLVFTLNQALELAKLGVNYISVFVGRLYDNNVDGLSVAESIQNMLDTYDFDSELLVASVRNAEHVEGSILFGADAITLPVEVFNALSESPLTRAGLERFKQDWEGGPHAQLLE